MKIVRLFTTLTLLLTVLGIGGFVGQPVSADVFSDVCATNAQSSNNPEKSSVCVDKASTSNPLTGPDGLILKVSYIIASLAGVVAVIMIIVAGAKMINSGGDANKVKEARTKITHAVIGLVVIVFAQGIVALIVGRLLA